MMKLEVNINESELKEIACQMIARDILTDRTSGLNHEARMGVREGIDKAVKQYIYAKKDEIIERVIEKASVEIVKKALPKLLDKLS
jgi:hypothetical protein